MKRHTLLSLALVSASLSLLGCSRTSRKVSTGILADREIAQIRPEALKPSPCIKWDDPSGRFTKRKTRGASDGKGPQKT